MRMERITNWATYTTAKLRGAQKNAEARGIEWALTDTDIARLLARANGKCELTAHPFVLNGDGKREPWAPSLDRIDSARGYTPDNVRLVCVVVNYALHEFGDSVFFEMVEAVKAIQAQPAPARQERNSSAEQAARMCRQNTAQIEALEARIAGLEARAIAGEPAAASGVRITQVQPISFSGATQVTTEDFARLNNISPHSLRSALCRKGSYFGVTPMKLANGRLVWPATRVQ